MQIAEVRWKAITFPVLAETARTNPKKKNK